MNTDTACHRHEQNCADRMPQSPDPAHRKLDHKPWQEETPEHEQLVNVVACRDHPWLIRAHQARGSLSSKPEMRAQRAHPPTGVAQAKTTISVLALARSCPRSVRPKTLHQFSALHGHSVHARNVGARENPCGASVVIFRVVVPGSLARDSSSSTSSFQLSTS